MMHSPPVASLEQQVTEYVLANPESTAVEVAGGVKARLADVREVLGSAAFTAAPRASYRSDRAVVYRIAFGPQDAPGRADRPAVARRRPSQCDLIAAVLADGRFHTAAELHQRCGYSRLNSRVAELRSRRGMNIVCEHVPGTGTGPDAYRYRLIPSGAPEAAAVEPSPPAAASGVPDTVPSVPSVGAPEQLSLGAAA